MKFAKNRENVPLHFFSTPKTQHRHLGLSKAWHPRPPSNWPFTVQVGLESEDPGVPGRPGMIFDFDLHGFVCPHPETSGFFAMIEYSRRHPKGQPPLAGRNEGEQFLESLEIMAVRP